MGNFRLPPTCLVYYSLQQQESQTYSYIENCWGLWLYGYNISHFGEHFRSGHDTLVSFLFAPRCFTCPAICKSGGSPRALWFRPTVWDTAPRWCCMVRLSERRKSLILVQGKALVRGLVSPRSLLFVKMGARAPVPYGSVLVIVTKISLSIAI